MKPKNIKQFKEMLKSYMVDVPANILIRKTKANFQKLYDIAEKSKPMFYISHDYVYGSNQSASDVILILKQIENSVFPEEYKIYHNGYGHYIIEEKLTASKFITSKTASIADFLSIPWDTVKEKKGNQITWEEALDKTNLMSYSKSFKVGDIFYECRKSYKKKDCVQYQLIRIYESEGSKIDPIYFDFRRMGQKTKGKNKVLKNYPKNRMHEGIRQGGLKYGNWLIHEKYFNKMKNNHE